MHINNVSRFTKHVYAANTQDDRNNKFGQFIWCDTKPKKWVLPSWIEALTLSLESQEVLILADFQMLNTEFSRDKHENLIQMKNIIALF